jgi:monothiol glutaredoxin|tara:strand:+ start:30 stop:338 length:309 start_codon:yes stop_codon:yes gene_type:complete
MSEIEKNIKEMIASNDVVLFMKGNPNQPQCGFSAKVVQCLKEVGKPFGYVDILSDPEVRATLPSISDWPTFPQLFVKGELMGGCDIITEMHANGELKTLLAE